MINVPPFLAYFFNLGITEHTSAVEAARIQSLNRLCFAAGSVALLMIPVLSDSIPAMLGVSLYAVCLYSVFIFHYFQQYLAFNVFITISLAILNVMFASGFEQRMGLEVHFIVTFVTILYHFSEHKMRVFDAIFTGLSFLVAMYMQFHHLYFFPAPRLTPYLFLVNNLFGLCFLAFIILRFRYTLKKTQDDIEQKNQLLEQQKQTLQEMNNIKDKLFSIIGHDLRAPLASMHGLLTLLESEFLTQEEKVKYIQKLKTAISGSSETLDNLVFWYMQQQHPTVNREKMKLGEVADTAINTLKILAEQKEIQLSHKIAYDVYTYTNPNFLPFVLRNFIANAIKFTPNGGEVVVYIAQQTNKEVWIAVKDTGIGVTPENLIKLFHSNESFTTEGTNKEKGTGLGLAFCKEFGEKIGSRIWAESQIGKGSTFYFSLPIYEMAS